jgi:excisionase family DNA binding protein
MDSTNNSTGNPAFYTVPEAARILRVTPATLYRAIRDDAFPAVRIRTRYVIPASAVDRLAAEAAGPADAWTSHRWPLNGVPPAR